MLITIWKNMKGLERSFLILLSVAIIFRYIFRYGPVMDIIVFTAILSLLYFPMGFYFLGKPNTDKPIFISILIGLLYFLAQVIFILGVFKIDDYQYPLAIVFLLILLGGLFLLYKLNTNQYQTVYVYSQFLRIGFILIINLIALFFGQAPKSLLH